MLAYIFWHEPDPEVEAAEYERLLGRFHVALGDAPPEGFSRSTAYRVEGAPWLPGVAYEDWYLVKDWASVGRLEEAAVSGTRRSPHDAVAGVAGDGAGGLYEDLRGGTDLLAGDVALWFGKPRAVGYAEFVARLEDVVPEGSPIWQRKLTLGPGREFCVTGARDPLRFAAAGLGPSTALVERRRVWP